MDTTDLPGGPRITEVDDEGRICLHEVDEDKDVTTLLGDTPRVDFYFERRGEEDEEEEWTAVYKAAVKFSTALPPGRELDEEELEDFIATCPMAITGPGGSGDFDEEDEEDSGEGEEGKEGGEGGLGKEFAGYGRTPFSLVFPTARRVADFLAWVVHVGPIIVWGGDEELMEGRYEARLRLHWRMDMSEFIPLVA